MKRRPLTVAVVTGSRADFGLLRPVMAAIADHRDLQLQVVVAGLHLTRRTWPDVREAGLPITARVAVQKPGQTGRPADVQALGRGVAGFGRTFQRLGPQVVLLLGDRLEIFAAAAAAQLGGYHLAHIHGGDRAEGVADEAMRHAISKMAHVHFVATARSRRRLIRMGEPAERVFRTGSPALDDLKDVRPATDARPVIVLQHPVGRSDEQEYRWMAATLAATRRYRPLVLAPNDDAGSPGIRRALRRAGIRPVEHLPRRRFLSLLAGARVIVGNSSAGLIEAAALGTACVNVGPRQAGREKPANVIDCDYGRQPVGRALARAMTLNVTGLRHPYGDGRAGPRIAALLAEIDWKGIPLQKHNAY